MPRLPQFLFLGLLLAGCVTAAPVPPEPVRTPAAEGVHWQHWNDETLARARASGRSIYVFVGSPLSELTRATIKQTFGSEKTVAWLNENFFCIFVDAEAQPDVAAFAQHYLRSHKQLQGLPAHLWLTSDLQPYDGANYLPPSEEWGKPGFLKAAREALDTWTVEPNRARALAAEAISMMKVPPLAAATKTDPQVRLDAAAKAWIATVDAKNGGFGTAPKQPEPELIRFLLGRDAAGRDAALGAARALVAGATLDPVDGGFYRRAIDEEAKEPYYQKTLADQARIALALYDCADAAKDDKLRQAAVGALRFAVKHLRNPSGSFATALDGTLEENADPAKRPNFVLVGTANTGAQGLLLTALLRSGDASLAREAKVLTAALRLPLDHNGSLPHVLGQPVPTPATAADYAAVALAFRALKDNATADRLLAKANELYFDPATGQYQASPASLPAGICARVPTSGGTPSAEALAVLAGVDTKTTGLLQHGLLVAIEYDEQPPGDALLALSRRP